MEQYENLTDDEDFLEMVRLAMPPRIRKTYRARPDNFNVWNDGQFLERFRLTKPTVRFIVDQIAPNIANKTMQ